MRYHLKEDGNPGVCTAEPGKCPKGDAIHGDSIQEVYFQLEKVMAEQLFKNKEPLFPAPKPRPSARELGSAGILVRTRQPFVVKQQLEGLRALGIVDQAIPTLEAHQPLLAGAVKANREDAVLWDELYERPQDYTYEGSGGASFIAQTDTWVADASYEIQTVALNHLMDTLENGELEGTDLKALGKALGNVTVPEDFPDKIDRNGNRQREDSFNFDYMAFNYNPERQGDDFFNGLKNRLAAEGFDKRKIGENKHEITVPDFLWKGLDTEAKERFAAQVLYKDLGNSWRRNFQDRIFHRPNFSDVISRTFAPKDSERSMIQNGKLSTIGLDHNGSTVSGVMTLTESGFRWTEQERHYVESPSSTADRW